MGKAGDQQLPIAQPQPQPQPPRGSSRTFLCHRCAAGASRLVNFKCALVLMLSLAAFLSAAFWFIPSRYRHPGFDAKASVKLSGELDFYMFWFGGLGSNWSGIRFFLCCEVDWISCACLLETLIDLVFRLYILFVIVLVLGLKTELWCQFCMKLWRVIVIWKYAGNDYCLFLLEYAHSSYWNELTIAQWSSWLLIELENIAWNHSFIV